METRNSGFGIHAIVAAAALATDNLVKSGFSAADVAAVLPKNQGSRPLATEKSTKAPEARPLAPAPVDRMGKNS